MGIQGLLPLLKPASMTINVKELAGCVAVVDVYCWLHKAAYGCGEDLYHRKETSYYVDYCIYRVEFLKKMGIKCILVFDGQNLPSKVHTEVARKRNREKAREKIANMIEVGNHREASELMKRSVDITPEMAKKLIVSCRQRKIDYIVAPYEADAQIAYLIKKKIGNFVITEDSDLLLFECDYVMVKLDRNGDGILIRKSKIIDCLGPKSKSFTFEKFRRMCILSGCDYLPNLPGIGLQKAKKFFSITMCDDMTKALPKLPTYLRIKGLKVDQVYIKGFLRSENTFKYQLVFCPIQRRLVPLNPYETNNQGQNMDYAGHYLDNELALELALGNVDIKTMNIIDNYKPPFFSSSSVPSDDSIWSANFKPKPINPLDIRFGLATPEKTIHSEISLKRSSSLVSPQPFKKLHTETFEDSVESSYSQSSEFDLAHSSIISLPPSSLLQEEKNKEEQCSPVKQKARQSLNDLIEQRSKKRQMISFLCSLGSSHTGFSQTSEASTQSSACSTQTSNGSPDEDSILTDSQSVVSTPIEQATPILKDSPPPENASNSSKSVSLSFLEQFVYKKRTAQKTL